MNSGMANSVVLTPALLRMPVAPSPSPYTQRPTDPRLAAKYYELAISGLKIKYEGEDKVDYTIPVFAKSVERHLKLHGLHEDFFFTDKADGIDKSIIHHYDCFTLEEIVVATNQVTDIAKVDNMDRSGKFLSDSLSHLQLGKQMKYHQYPTHGPVVWMLIIKENWSGSESALKSLALQLEKITLADIEGENVSELATKIDNICQRLDAANMLPREILHTLCHIFCTSSNDLFNTVFKNIYGNLDDPSFYRHTYSTLLEKAVRTHRNLQDSGRWMSTKKVTRAFHAETSGLKQVAFTKHEHSKKVKCYECGGPHYANECSKRSNNNKGKKTQAKRWKQVPPRSGGTTKKTVDGVNYSWCAKCQRWTTTHTTQEHRNKTTKTNATALLADDDEASYSSALATMTMAGF
ncbi:MAG: hypothetical protein ACREBR_01130 [bacterium]